MYVYLFSHSQGKCLENTMHIFGREQYSWQGQIYFKDKINLPDLTRHLRYSLLVTVTDARDEKIQRK